MYAMYYASMLQCYQLVRILVRTNHPCLRVGCHNFEQQLAGNQGKCSLTMLILCSFSLYFS
jgi:hypothetical protein